MKTPAYPLLSYFEHPLTRFSNKTPPHICPVGRIAPDVSYFSSLLLPNHLKQDPVEALLASLIVVVIFTFSASYENDE